jgi:hypothetical protein
MFDLSQCSESGRISTFLIGSGRLGPDLDPDPDVFKSRIWSKIVRIRNTRSNGIWVVFTKLCNLKERVVLSVLDLSSGDTLQEIASNHLLASIMVSPFKKYDN